MAERPIPVPPDPDDSEFDSDPSNSLLDQTKRMLGAKMAPPAASAQGAGNKEEPASNLSLAPAKKEFVDTAVSTRRTVSQKKLEANRRNAQRSTGPKTERGKRYASINALVHGMLCKKFVVQDGIFNESSEEFFLLLAALRVAHQPVGIIEELWVDRIAKCHWKLKRADQCEAGLVVHGQLNYSINIANRLQNTEPLTVLEYMAEEHCNHLAAPLSKELDLLLRYRAAINRELMQATSQLERLQRERRGEQVPPPVHLHVSSD